MADFTRPRRAPGSASEPEVLDLDQPAPATEQYVPPADKLTRRGIFWARTVIIAIGAYLILAMLGALIMAAWLLSPKAAKAAEVSPVCDPCAFVLGFETVERDEVSKQITAVFANRQLQGPLTIGACAAKIGEWSVTLQAGLMSGATKVQHLRCLPWAGKRS